MTAGRIFWEPGCARIHSPCPGPLLREHFTRWADQPMPREERTRRKMASSTQSKHSQRNSSSDPFEQNRHPPQQFLLQLSHLLRQSPFLPSALQRANVLLRRRPCRPKPIPSQPRSQVCVSHFSFGWMWLSGHISPCNLDSCCQTPKNLPLDRALLGHNPLRGAHHRPREFRGR